MEYERDLGTADCRQSGELPDDAGISGHGGRDDDGDGGGTAGECSGYKVYVYADGDNGSATGTGAYQISGTGITTTSVNLTDAANTNFSGTFTQANNSAGNYVLFTITATGFTITATPGTSTDANPRAPVNAIQIVPLAPTTPNFSLTATPSTQTVVVGNATTYTDDIGAVDGIQWGGDAECEPVDCRRERTQSFSPATVTGSGTSTLTVTTTVERPPLGTRPLTITGTSGSLTQTASVGLTVSAVPPPPNFTLTVTPSTQTVVVGNETTYTTTIGALNGFGGVVTLSASGLPAGATSSFSPATVTGRGSSTLTVTTRAGRLRWERSTLTITGTSGSLTQRATTTLAVVAAAAIGIKFVGQGTAMGSTEVAGVVAQSNWNDASGTTSTTPLALINQAGASRGATVTWNTNGIWELPITDTPGNYRMMRGYLDTSGGVTTVTVAGLAARQLQRVRVRGRGQRECDANGGVSDQRDGDHDDECESDGSGEHELQRDVHAGQQLGGELCDVHDHGDGVHDHGDARDVD